MLFLYMLFVGALVSTTTTAITAPTPTITTTPLASLNPREISSSTTSGIYFVSTMHIVVGGPTPNTIEIAIETCVQTITPDQNGYVPPGTCNSLWNYYPSFVAAAIFAVLFGVLTLAHIGQAIAYKKSFCWVLIMGAAWETVAFTFRTISTRYQQSMGVYLVFQISILLAPLWINAFDYMVLGRMIYYFSPSRSVFSIPAQTLALTFVSLDFISFIIQLVGGSWAGPTAPASRQLQGIHIYMGGIGLQQFFIFVFVALAVQFQREMMKLERSTDMLARPKGLWRKPLFTVYATLGLITIRIFFRLIEFSSGTTASSGLLNHEGYFYALEAVPMVLAVFAFNCVHPGSVLIGPRSELPGIIATLRATWRTNKGERLLDKS